MNHSKTTRENIIELLENDGFGDLQGGQIVKVSRQEQLNRALRLACESGYIDLVEKFHRDGAQIEGNPEPLCVAADFNELEIVHYLISNGADINAHSRGLGQTALMDAAGSASLRAFQYLLESGADKTLVCDDGKTALEWAEMGRNTASLPEMETDRRVIEDYNTIIELLKRE